jgi:chromosome segregation ATPase
MNCFKCGNAKAIINDIKKAGQKLGRNDNQVYIEVYDQNPKQSFQSLIEAKNRPIMLPTSSLDLTEGLYAQSPKGNIIIPNHTDASAICRVDRTENKDLKSKIEDYKQIVGKYKKTMQAMDEKNTDLNKDLEKKFEELVHMNVEVDKSRAEVKASQEKMREYDKEFIAFTKQIELLKISLEKKEDRILELHVMNSKYEDIIATNTAQITTLNDQLKSSNETFGKLEAALNDIKMMYTSKCQEVSELTGTVNQLKYHNQELKTSLDMFQGKYDEVKSQLDSNTLKLIDLNSIIQKFSETENRLKSEIIEKDQTIEELKRMFPE